MLKKIYHNFIGKKFLNKAFLINVAIMAIILFFMTYYIINSFSRITIDKELEYNTILLNNVKDYITNKYSVLNTISTQLYFDKFSTKSKFLVENNDMVQVFNFLQEDMDHNSLDYMESKQAFERYFSSVFSRDESITGISIYKLADKSVYQYTKALSNIYPIESYKFGERLKQIEDPYKPVIKIYPAVYPEYYDFSHDVVYTLAINLKSLDINKNIGILMVDFNVKGFSQLISKLNNKFNDEIILLTKDARVIFDSAGKYYDQKYPYFDILGSSTSQSNVKIEGKNYIVKKLLSADSNIIIAGIISRDNLLAKVRSIKYTIFLALLLCILLCIILMNVSSKILSRRVKLIMNPLGEIQKGNLTVKIPISNADDELDNIAMSINRMSEDLSVYIKKSYVMELKQKNAELTALQAQINPHFLYNTLETIRMKAIKNGDTNVGKMIYTLAKLFRSSIKGHTIIRVEEEVKYIELYLSLFKIRYEANFTYRLDIADEVLEYRIPKLLLQPVVENYIVHGFNAKADDNLITIKGYKKSQDICFIIGDNGVGIAPARLVEIKKALCNTDITHSDSMGLLNVNERIKIIFGNKYGLEIESDPGMGTMVEIRLPFIDWEELSNHVQGSDGR